MDLKHFLVFYGYSTLHSKPTYRRKEGDFYKLQLPGSEESPKSSIPSADSNVSTLNEATGVLPGCVLIIPRNRVTLHDRTWLYSLQTEMVIKYTVV